MISTPDEYFIEQNANKKDCVGHEVGFNVQT